jgi:hypothetical protein
VTQDPVTAAPVAPEAPALSTAGYIDLGAGDVTNLTVAPGETKSIFVAQEFQRLLPEHALVLQKDRMLYSWRIRDPYPYPASGIAISIETVACWIDGCNPPIAISTNPGGIPSQAPATLFDRINFRNTGSVPFTVQVRYKLIQVQ